MRVIFHNPHSENWYKLPLYFFLGKIKPVRKYEYLIDYFYNRGKVYVYIDKTNAVFPFSKKLKSVLPPLIEFYLWVLINRLNPLKFKILTEINLLRNDDVLFSFYYGHFAYANKNVHLQLNELVSKFRNCQAFKIFHFTHFYYNVNTASISLQNAKPEMLVAENDLAKTGFFKKYFPWYQQPVYTLPFIPQQRFIITQKFSERKNKAFAMGTITLPVMEGEFLDFFKNNQLQPMRSKIYEESTYLMEYIDSFISKLKNDNNTEDLKLDLRIKSPNELLENIKAFKGLFSIFYAVLKHVLSLGGNNGGQKDRQYMQINIVDKFNEYKMCIVPEECVGLPGISFVEAMACGCAFIGIKDPMYSNVGLVDGVNYIGYSGDTEDLKLKIRYYQQHSMELESIAVKGNKWVHETCKPEKVVETFLTYVKNKIFEKTGREFK